MKSVFKVNQLVIYHNTVYTIERDYGNNVYCIGNKDDFCDMVPGDHLREYFYHREIGGLDKQA